MSKKTTRTFAFARRYTRSDLFRMLFAGFLIGIVASILVVNVLQWQKSQTNQTPTMPIICVNPTNMRIQGQVTDRLSQLPLSNATIHIYGSTPTGQWCNGGTQTLLWTGYSNSTGEFDTQTQLPVTDHVEWSVSAKNYETIDGSTNIQDATPTRTCQGAFCVIKLGSSSAWIPMSIIRDSQRFQIQIFSGNFTTNIPQGPYALLWNNSIIRIPTGTMIPLSITITNSDPYSKFGADQIQVQFSHSPNIDVQTSAQDTCTNANGGPLCFPPILAYENANSATYGLVFRSFSVEPTRLLITVSALHYDLRTQMLETVQLHQVDIVFQVDIVLVTF